MSEPKPCKICNYSRQKSYGLMVPSLDQLKVKGCETLGFDPVTPVSVVLEDDGTIVEDDAYFLCLPTNTKFMLLHEKERWAPTAKMDGGTAWLSRESRVLDPDVAWRDLASRLKQELASIILFSEDELQSLVDVPCPELAEALGFGEDKAQALQDTLQRVLDRREEERQSKELLQLYLKAMEKEDGRIPSQEGEDVSDELDGMEVDASSPFSPRTLMVLKGKTSPETRISNEELQMVVKQSSDTMAAVLGWGAEKTSALLEACEDELNKRLEQVNAMQSSAPSPRGPAPTPRGTRYKPSARSRAAQTPCAHLTRDARFLNINAIPAAVTKSSPQF
ncbi:hypothetical protein AAFF_G00233440 [Aldrovandia affinis]|uniref:CIDE-N domain-containing protein n=1 Tax=Aldrovandia affinis TaxID=143900 RepID=A0AAD7RF18_9TELE|nr:hypothetical protein AAFF_G00233440 [Aldrovandia affinis]